ncbi:MAG: bifunctional hydroxymethylpyrimidine kinase/phosphomethylpyrimidine kinase [candidate division WOR-3 bacterium]
MPRVLVIAGSDSGGGAGIQADIKTLNSIGVFGMTAITSLTAQNTKGVFEIFDLPASFIKKQIEVVIEDIGVDAIKIGMLSNKDIIEAVIEEIRRYGIENIILDPVMKSQTGYDLIKEDAKKILMEKLLPLSLIVTPNRFEAEEISGLKIENKKDIKEAILKIKEKGAKWVLIKGGHFEGKYAIDYLSDGKNIYEIKAKRINTNNTHGSGCTYASAIAGYIAKGFDILSAVKKAKRFVYGAIKNSLQIGKGKGPVNHFWKIKEGG